MTDPADKQRMLNDYIVEFPDTRDREYKMIQDLAVALEKIEELTEELNVREEVE